MLIEIPERVLRQFPVHITNWPGCLATVSRATDFSSRSPGEQAPAGTGDLADHVRIVGTRQGRGPSAGRSLSPWSRAPRPGPYRNPRERARPRGHPGRALGPPIPRCSSACRPPPRVPPRPDPIGQTTTGPMLRRSAGDPGGTTGRGSSHSRSLSGADAVGNPTTDDAESGDRVGPSAGPPGRGRTGAW